MDEEAVSAVIGTVLVLGISVAGIGAVLFWGAPLIQEMQDRNAQASMTSDMLQVREAAGRLTGIDSSRSIGVNLPAGTLSIGGSSHILIAVSHESGCSPDLDGWTDGDAVLTLAGTGCTNPATVSQGILPIPPSSTGAYLYRLDDAAQVAVPVAVTPLIVAAQPINIETYDWLLEIRDTSGDILRQHWILRSDLLSWSHQSSGSDRSVHFAWGPVVSDRDGSTFAEGQYFASETAFGADDYFLRLNALDAGSEGSDSISGAGSRSVLVGLDSVTRRADGMATYALRYETYGAQAEGLCNTFTLRNMLRPASPLYTPTLPNALSCATDGTDVYTTSYRPASTPFSFEFLHAKISVDIQL